MVLPIVPFMPFALFAHQAFCFKSCISCLHVFHQFKPLNIMCKRQLFKYGCSFKKCDCKRQQLLFQGENCLLSFRYSFKNFLKTIQSHWQCCCAAINPVERNTNHAEEIHIVRSSLYSRHYKVFKPFDIILTWAPEILSNFKWCLNNILLCIVHTQGPCYMHFWPLVTTLSIIIVTWILKLTMILV